MKIYQHYDQAVQREIPAKIANSVDFDSTHMSARTVGNKYVVYSYQTPIAVEVGDPHKFMVNRYMSTSKYSVTTSKHQNLVRQAWFAFTVTYVDEDEFRKLLG